MTNEEEIRTCSSRVLAALLVSTRVNQGKTSYCTRSGVRCTKFNDAVTENLLWLKREVE